MTPAALLGVMWLASPALPVGGFSYSEGLEAAIDAGLVHDEAGVAQLLIDQLHLTLERSEIPVLVAAHLAWQAHDSEAVLELQQWLLDTRESAELRQQTLQMGRSLAAWLAPQHDDPRIAVLQALPPGPAWPIAFALAGVLADADPRNLALAFTFGWAENLVQAAVKAVPLGQTAGQRMLRELVQAIPGAVDRALADPSHRQCFAPGLAILSSRHEVQYSRLFRS